VSSWNLLKKRLKHNSDQLEKLPAQLQTVNQNPLPPIVCRKKVFDFAVRPYVMGIVNVTPDSFSDGGQYESHEQAIAQGLRLAAEGADIIDIGGESTRPGAQPVSAAEEIERILPVIQELSARISVPISVDTSKAEVARQALAAGAEMVNDVSALRFDPDMGAVVAAYKVPVVLMHMQGTPRTMQRHIHYESLLDEIQVFLQERIEYAVQSGIAVDRIIVDPGIGFGKSTEKDNFTILKHLSAFSALGRPVLVGTSRKAFIGRLLNAPVHEREPGTAATVAIAVYNGAHFIRVHDVKTMSMVARVAEAIRKA
jgi:dihydropteroate synthase